MCLWWRYIFKFSIILSFIYYIICFISGNTSADSTYKWSRTRASIAFWFGGGILEGSKEVHEKCRRLYPQKQWEEASGLVDILGWNIKTSVTISSSTSNSSSSSKTNIKDKLCLHGWRSRLSFASFLKSRSFCCLRLVCV